MNLTETDWGDQAPPAAFKGISPKKSKVTGQVLVPRLLNRRFRVLGFRI